MQNIRELVESLADNYEKTKKGEMQIKLCKELSNNAGKIVNALRLELEYNEFMDKQELIPFLECGGKKINKKDLLSDNQSNK